MTEYPAPPSFSQSQPFYDLPDYSTIIEESTQTTIIQNETHRKVYRLLEPYYNKLQEFSSDEERQKFQESFVLLLKNLHIPYCINGLNNELSSRYLSLDASRAWMIYWLVHSLSLLGFSWDSEENKTLRKKIIETIKQHQSNTGGFSGGVQFQISHLATTYASINAITEIGTEDAYEIIDRVALKKFFLSLKVDNGRGGVRMHEGGEIDIRGIYCMLSCSTLTGILDEEIACGLDEYVLSCQSYEGGISSYPGTEAHGGYTYCGLASMILLKKQDKLDLDSLALWNARRQMEGEGGFQGRNSKVVDVCYSLWVGGVFPLLEAAFTGRKLEITKEEQMIYDYIKWRPENFDRQIIVEKQNYSFSTNKKSIIEFEDLNPKISILPKDRGLQNEDHLFNQEALQEYILLCCQSIRGGLIDKPGCGPDFYHTCFALSGLSIAQHNRNGTTCVLGNPSNLLKHNNPIFNVTSLKVGKILKYFSNKESL